MAGVKALCFFVGLAATALAATTAKTAALKLPLEFEANQGQFAPDVLFLARTPSHFVYLTRHGLTLGVSASTQRGAAMQMNLVAADPAVAVMPENLLAGVSNYFIGNNPANWQRGAPHFGRIRYRAVWPGIDLVFHGRDQELEYDFVVAPGADPSAICLSYANAGSMRLDHEGNLVIETATGRVVQRLPLIYQESAGIRKAVRGNFRIAGNHDVRFQVAAYDRRRPLVIDPTITYSTYLGGTGTLDIGGIAVDGAGNLYITGTVSSPDFPVVNPIQQTSGSIGLFRSSNQGATWGSASSNFGTSKVLSLATDPTNAAVAYSGTSQGVFKTTNGGGSWALMTNGLPTDRVSSIAVDPKSPSTLYACLPEGLFKSTDAAATWKLLPNAGGPIVVAVDAQTEGKLWLGYEFDYPIVSFDGGATFFQANLARVITKAIAIDPANSSNVFYGTQSGGLLITGNSGLSFVQVTQGLTATNGSAVTVNSIAIDRRNSNRMLVGTDTGVYLSVTSGVSFQPTQGLGNRKVLSVVFAPNTDSIALAGVAGGGVYMSSDGGLTWTSTGPANLDVNALAVSSDEQSTWAALYSSTNAFVTKINPSGTAVLYSSYLGGSGQSGGHGLAVDANGHAFLCGTTDASDFPTQNPYQRFSGGSDIFVSRLSAAGSLDDSTLLGGHADDECNGVALDQGGGVYVAGSSTLLSTARSDFPTTPGVIGPQSFGGQDCIVAKFDNTLQNLIYSTFLGGNQADNCYSIAVDSQGSAYVAGVTYSANFLTTQNPFGGSKASGSSTNSPGFVAKFKPDASGLVYSALLGGAQGATQLSGIAVNSAGRAFVTGYTSASDYPVTSGAMNKTLAGVPKTVLTAIETDGSKLIYSTFMAGSKPDYGGGLAVDSNNNVWLAGEDLGGAFPVTSDALPHTVNTTLFTPWVAQVDATGSNLLHATYVGGSAGGVQSLIALAPDGSVYSGGTTLSTDFTQTGTPFKQVPATNYNLYMMRLVFPAVSVGGVPIITAVQNGASFQNGFAAGAWMTIKGSNLSTGTDTWDKAIVNNQLPTSLDGVSVSIGAQPAYIYFVSPGQINVVTPNVPPGAVSVTVTNSQGTSASFSATAQTPQPAFFLWNNTYAVATRQDFSYAVKNQTFAGLTTAPAKPGDVIILWGTGFGPTNPAAPTGFQVPASSFPTANPVAVTIGTQAVTVFGAALAPGFAALYQVAIQIPTTMADGDYPIFASIGGQSSPATAIITVQH